MTHPLITLTTQTLRTLPKDKYKLKTKPSRYNTDLTKITITNKETNKKLYICINKKFETITIHQIPEPTSIDLELYHTDHPYEPETQEHIKNLTQKTLP